MSKCTACNGTLKNVLQRHALMNLIHAEVPEPNPCSCYHIFDCSCVTVRTKLAGVGDRPCLQLKAI